jgi:hypothetical protein
LKRSLDAIEYKQGGNAITPKGLGRPRNATANARRAGFRGDAAANTIGRDQQAYVYPRYPSLNETEVQILLC